MPSLRSLGKREFPRLLKAASWTLNHGPGPVVTGIVVCELSEPSALVSDTCAVPENVKELLPPALIVVEEGETVTPSGMPATVARTGSLNPFCPFTVRVMLSFRPGATVICTGETLKVKLAGAFVGVVVEEI